MILEKKKLLALADRWDKKARNAEARYQESGDQRHLREKENTEDIADALRMAANAEEDYSELVVKRARLAAYEATGMTPAEIATLKKERDAAVRDLEALMGAGMDGDGETSECDFCKLGQEAICPKPYCVPEWRGPQEPEQVIAPADQSAGAYADNPVLAPAT